MSSSESEAFQSADEDYESAKPVKKTPSSEASDEKCKKPTRKIESENSADKIKDLGQIVDVINSPDKSIATAPSSEKVQKDSSVEQDNDGWDLDEWGEDDNVKETSTAEANSVEDGWADDFGDWGSPDNDSASLEANKKTKDIKKIDDGDQPKIVSTYDTFPVLNDLTYYKEKKETSPVNAAPPAESKPSAGPAWGWKPWGGVVSFLSSASEGVSTLTSQVSQGLSNVIENSIGVPDPEEMARSQVESERRERERRPSEDSDDKNEAAKEEHKTDTIRNSLGNIVSGVTQIGNKVITGGLDTLEGIGKKTMTILQENDPLLLNKRKLLGMDTDKPVLSQILREAKEKSEESEKNLKQMHKDMYRKQLHYETLFDHYHGLVHLEALEMLSRQSSIKLQSLLEPLTGKALSDLQETLNEVNELCDLGDMESDETDGLYEVNELQEKINLAKEDLDVDVDLSDLIRCWKENTEWLCESTDVEAQDVYEKALRCLAETTALAVHKMHKIAEMLLIKDHHSTANEADSLVQLTILFCWHLSGVSNRFCGKLNEFDGSEEISSQITSIFLEASNSTTYVRSAFQLFIPILQIGAA